MLLGCIADDLTGATDLSLTLSREGLRTVQTTGLPDPDLDLGKIDAVVVALKSRTIPAADAVAQSLEAADRLKAAGARRLFFKYCSTFDSTDAGNIGPVAEALMAHLGIPFTIACPAFPANGRSIYMGQLFVNGVPLAESPMRDHPLTPMRDSDLRRVLRRQTRDEVGHVAYADVEAGPGAIASAFAREAAGGRSIAIVDAITDAHLRAIGEAAGALELVTGGSGVALGLPAAYRKLGLIAQLTPPQEALAAPHGRAIVLAGSCSAATRGAGQNRHRSRHAGPAPRPLRDRGRHGHGLRRPRLAGTPAARHDPARLFQRRARPRAGRTGKARARGGRQSGGKICLRPWRGPCPTAASAAFS